MRQENLTKSFIAALPFSQCDQLINDTEVPQLVLRVGKSKRTFFVRRRVRGRQVEVKIGNAESMHPTLARKKALETLGKMEMGIDPRRESRAQVTLAEVLEDFLADRQLRDSTRRSYKSIYKTYLSRWASRDITDIHGEDVLEVYRRVVKEGRSETANLAMRTMRALMNYAIARYRSDEGKPLLLVNPVRALSERRVWVRSKRRKRIVPLHAVPGWWAALDGVPNQVNADALRVMLLTGLRLNEVQTMDWKDVDLKDGFFTVPGDTAKNHDDLVLPMTATLRAVFERRGELRVNRFVFPANAGHIVDTRKTCLQVTKVTGYSFTPHDLRRTFATTAESIDLSAYTLKRLLNHKMGSDVTAGYITWHPARLLEPLQRIEDALLRSTPRSEPSPAPPAQ
jgi:integrase